MSTFLPPTLFYAEITEDVLGAGETAESTQNLCAPPRAVSPPSQEREPYKKLGLTKAVLASHTQKEEQAFLYRIRELRGLSALQANGSQTLDPQRDETSTDGTIKHQFAAGLLLAHFFYHCVIEAHTNQ